MKHHYLFKPRLTIVWWLSLLILCITQASYAQLYYGVSDVGGTTANDQLRRVPLSGTVAEETVVGPNTSGYPISPTLLAYDQTNNRIFVVNSFNNAQRIVAVNVTTKAVTTFIDPASSGGTSTQITGLVVVGATPTTISSITRNNANPTNAATINYTVTFGGPVTGLTASNFSLTTSGLSGASVSSVSGSGSTYTVAVNTGSGSGALTLNLANSTGVTPSISTTLPFVGETYTIDKNAPDTFITVFPTSPSTSNAPFFQFRGTDPTVNNVSSGVASFQAQLDGGGFVTVTSPLGYRGLTDGSHTFQVRAVDAVGNIDPSPASYTWVIDATPPQAPLVVAPATGSFLATTTPIYSGTAEANSTVTVIVDGSSIGSTMATTAGSWSLTQPTALAQGSYSVRSRATDQIGNTSVDSNTSTFTVDMTPPTVSITSLAGNNGGTTATSPIPFTVTFSESVMGFGVGDLTVTGGTVANFSGSGTTYTVNVTPSGSGATVTVNVAVGVAQDAAGNGNTASNAVSVQFQAPSITVAPASLPNGTQSTAYSQVLSASGGTAPYTYAITGGALPAGLTLSSIGTIAGTPTTNGAFTFTVTVRDNSAAPGPYSGSRAYTLVINPQPVTAAPVVTTPANGSQTNNRQPTYAGAAPANSTITVYMGAGTARAIGTTTADASGNFSLVQPTALADGVYLVYATAQINGSTVSAKSNTNSFMIDTTVPTVALSSATVANGGATSTSPVLFTATFSEPVTAFGSAGLAVTNGTVTSGPTAGSSNTYTIQVTPNGAGNVTVQVRANAAQDQAGNNNPASASYALTFQAPTIAIAPASLPNGTQGVAYSQTLTASGGTAPYTYVITARALPSGLTLTPAGVLSGTPAASGSFTFTVTATDNSAAPGPYSGFRDYTLIIAAPAVTAVTWTGTVSTDWFNANNWMPNQVPDATIDVTIPTSPSGGRFPAITPGAASTRNLTINSGATLTQISGTLAIAANLTNNGTFQPTGGTVVLGTTALSNIVGSSAVRFWNLTVGTSGAQLSTSIGSSVQRLLALNGNFATNGNSFTLESNASSTAMVVNNGSVVNGNVTVQRYIDPSNPGLGYRHYSSPVGNTTIADLATSSFTPVVNDSYNPATAPRQVQPYPTVYYYDQSRLATSNASYAVGDFDNGFLSPNALASPLVPGRGYSVNISGTTLVDLVGQLNNGTITTGTLARGAQSNAGWQFLGNPYPSPIDWNQLYAASAGIESGFYVFKSSGQYTGAYATYLTNGQSINGGINTIPSMQGFFVRVAPGQTGSVSFTNSCRLTSYANPAFARQAADTRPTIRLELLTAQGQKDEALVYFEPGATSGVDARYDAVKLGNISRLNLCSRVGSDYLAINGLPNLSASPLTVPLSVQVPSTGRYTLLASQLANVAGHRVVLRDRQTGTLTDLTDSTGYMVELTEGQHGDRFDLLFNPATEPPLDKKGQSIPAKRH